MMVDYLQEMSSVGPPESQDGALVLQSRAPEDVWERKGEAIHHFPLLLMEDYVFFGILHMIIYIGTPELCIVRPAEH